MKRIVVMKSSARNTLCVIENYGIVDALFFQSRAVDNENVLKHNKSQSSLNRFRFFQINLRVWMAFRFGNLLFFSLLCFLHNGNALLRQMNLRLCSVRWNSRRRRRERLRESSRNFKTKFYYEMTRKVWNPVHQKPNPQRKRNSCVHYQNRSLGFFVYVSSTSVCFMSV